MKFLVLVCFALAAIAQINASCIDTCSPLYKLLSFKQKLQDWKCCGTLPILPAPYGALPYAPYAGGCGLGGLAYSSPLLPYGGAAPYCPAAAPLCPAPAAYCPAAPACPAPAAYCPAPAPLCPAPAPLCPAPAPYCPAAPACPAPAPLCPAPAYC